MTENVGTQRVLADRAGRGSVDLQGHLGGDLGREQHVGYLLLRAPDGVGRSGLRPEQLDDLLDCGVLGFVTDAGHTKKLVEYSGPRNQKVCLAANQGAGKLSADMEIGSNLRRLREQAGMSQAKLAEVAGVSRQLISRLANGRAVATTKLPALAKALNAKVQEIDPKFSDVTDEAIADVAELRSVMQQLDAPDRRRVAAFAEALLRSERETERNE